MTDEERRIRKAAQLAQARFIDCATCIYRIENDQPAGPSHTSPMGHRNHCSCDGCY